MTLGARNMVAVAAALAACGGPESGIGGDVVTGADETVTTSESALSSSVAVGSILATTADLNLRSGPGMSYGVLRVMPEGDRVTAEQSAPSSGWYKIKHQGVVGWSYGIYLRLVSAPPPPTETPASTGRDAAISRAKSGVGFSYWWGHGRFLSGGPSSSTRGSCTGSCPSCSHGGSYGADCSGYLGKVWQVNGADAALSVDQHPYSTWHYANESHGWHGKNRNNLVKADALVYNSNGSGHTFLYESGDSWGSMWAYEAKGCSYGIVHNLRTASTSFRGIARDGY